MTAELKDFINDWKLDIPHKTATHNSGLKIGYERTNEDGSLRLSYEGMSEWVKKAWVKYKNVQKVDDERDELSRQFVEIYKNKMSNLNQNNNSSILHRNERDY